VRWTVLHVPARIGIETRHQRIKIEIAKTGEQRIAMLRRKLQHRLNHGVGKIAAACLPRTSLGNIEANVHELTQLLRLV
jgi:hypothetical protein